MKNKSILMLIALIAILHGCITQKRCNSKFPPQVVINNEHTIETIRKDSILKGATVTHTIVKDSIVFMPVNQWRVIKDTSGYAELRYYKDAYGNIIAQCQANDRMVEKIEQRIKEQFKSSSSSVVVKKETPWWMIFLLGLISTFAILLFLAYKFKINIL